MPTDWTKLQSQAIDMLRFPMAVAVVMLHYSVLVIDGAHGMLREMCICFQEGICRLAVPCFYFISGYLFFHGLRRWSWDVWKRKLHSRVRTLLVPYFLWNLLAFFAYWAWINLSGTRVGIFEEFQNLGGIRIFYNRLGSLPLGPQAPPLDDPLWFIRDLMYFVLATPAIYLFLKWTKGFGVLGICVLFLVIPGSIPEGFVFFVLGAFLQYSEKNIIASFYPTRSWFYCMTILLLIGTCLLHDVSDYWYRFIKFFFILNGVITSFCLAVTLLRRNPELPHPFLARSSFFIFAIHNVLILKQIATPIVYTIIPVDTPVGSIAAYFLVPAFVVGICLGLLFLMEHLLPRTTSLLTGNRKIKSSYA